MIPWLENVGGFPPLEHALSKPNGLLCASENLSPERVVEAYCAGIFPWYSPGEPVLWWSPNPRMVLFPSEVTLSRSLRKTLRTSAYEVRFDSAFSEVIAACADTPRKNQQGTWITPEITSTYTRLFEQGFAHSVETWENDVLVGGLYGLAIGKVFYGESMFSRKTDASKIAFAHLVSHLLKHGVELIDCQMKTSHLASFGAREIPRNEFVARVKTLIDKPPRTGRWERTAACHIWNVGGKKT